MWYAIRTEARARPAPPSPAPQNDLATSSVRTIIIAVGGLYALLVLASEALTGGRTGGELWLLAPLMLAACGLGYTLVLKHYLLSQAIFQVGVLATIILAARLSRQPDAIICASFLPLLATFVAGWPAGVLVEVLVAAGVWWLSSDPAMPPLSPALSLATSAAGAAGIVLGWASARTFLETARTSVAYSSDMVREAEEARAQRLEFRQVQEDLIHANGELARLSDRLKAMYQIAEEARRAKEEFVCNVSHELRTPLNMIIGFSEIIPKLSQVYGSKPPPALLSDIAAIRRNSQHLSRLVDDVLDLSQIESGRMAVTKEWTPIHEAVEEAAAAVLALFDSKGLYLNTDVAPDLPPVFCDATRIRQVILNLLSNAGRFTESGGVDLRARCDGAEVIISVSDTGPGISPEDQARIFQPFQQLDGSIRRRHGGSGLGLCISKQLVELHGGRMWLESELGAGTTFYIALPLEAPLPVALASADRAQRWFSPHSTEWEYRQRTRAFRAPLPVAAPRLVVLEEGDTVAQLSSRYLQGAEIAKVTSIEEATRELKRMPAQALIVNAPPLADCSGSDGMSDLPYGTPAIRCWLPGQEDAARRLGVVRYLVKPVSSEALLSAVNELGDDVRDILVVDDEPEALQLFSRMLALSPRGYRVLQAQSGDRALKLLIERRPDALLLDLAMPGMDGFQVLHQKSRDERIKHVPVVIVSARDPAGEAIVSPSLTVTRSGGLSAHDLLACIEALSAILAPAVRPSGREQPGTLPG